MLSCPSQPESLVFKTGVTSFTQQWSYSYGINDIIAQDCVSADDSACRHIGVAGHSTTSIDYPSNAILIADNLPSLTDTGEGDNFTLGHSRHEINRQWGHRDTTKLTVNGMSQDGFTRHGDRFVLVFSDGHASTRSRKQNPDGTFVPATKDGEWLANNP